MAGWLQTKKVFALFSSQGRLKIILLFMLILISSSLQALGVASVLPFINLVMNPGVIFDNPWLRLAYDRFGFGDSSSFIIFFGILMFCLIVTANGVSAITAWARTRYIWNKNHALSKQLMEQYLAKPYVYFLYHNTAELGRNILNEVNILTESFLFPLIELITRGLIVFLIIVILLVYNPWITLVAIALTCGGYGLIFLTVRKKLGAAGKARFEANSQRFKTVAEAFGGIKEARVLGRERTFLDDYALHSRLHTRYLSYETLIARLPKYALEATAFGGIILLVIFLIVTGGQVNQIIPVVAFYTFAGYRIMSALEVMFYMVTNLKFNQAVVDKVYSDLVEGNSCWQGYQAGVDRQRMSFMREIRLKEVSYKYPQGEQMVLDGLNITIDKGSFVGLVGVTGAGKTTLIDLILGLLVPVKGCLVVDDRLITADNVRQWQNIIGYVPQEIFFSDDTVSRNIAYGVPVGEIDPGKVEKAARIAGIDCFITGELPDGYNTVIGERGMRLSGGQRQKIGLARALYNDPEVIILDEATSSLDSDSEDSVLKEIHGLMGVKTIIMITHRVSTVKECDLVYFMDKGKIAARGTYEQLVAANPKFCSLAREKKHYFR